MPLSVTTTSTRARPSCASGCELETAALRVFSNADGAYGSNVNLLVETGRWEDGDELADQFVRRKCFGYGVSGCVGARAELMERLLADADLAFQNVDSVELGVTDIDQYVDALGGVARTIARRRGEAPPTYLGDHTAGGDGAVRSLVEQVALETRTRALNPKWYEGQLAHGFEGVRNLASRVTTTLGWSATTGAVPRWVYAGIGETFVLDPAMRDRLARLNPTAASGMAERLLEAADRGLWTPDADTLARLRDAAAELEDRMEGITT